MEKFQTRSILQQEKASYKKLRGFKRKPVIKKSKRYLLTIPNKSPVFHTGLALV